MDVKNNKQKNQFELELEGKIARIEYEIKNGIIYLFSTQVPEAFKGQGIGSKLAKETMEVIEMSGMKFVAICPFVKAWLKRHPEKAYPQDQE